MAEFPDVTLLPVQTKNCGVPNVYVQGNPEERNGKTTSLPSTTQNRVIRFVNHPSMSDVKAKAIGTSASQAKRIIWLNTRRPPDSGLIGEDLAAVSRQNRGPILHRIRRGRGCQHCLPICDGIPEPHMAIILVHCTPTTAGILEDTTNGVWRVASCWMGAWDVLAAHKFGSNERDKQEYIDSLKSTLKCQVIITVWMRCSFQAWVERPAICSRCTRLMGIWNRKKTTLLVVDNVCDVMSEAVPDNLARLLILLCKGCGMLSGVAIPGMERQRTLSR
ncbi:unnamed protein product, partial [Mesorhabditis spiculigera]